MLLVITCPFLNLPFGQRIQTLQFFQNLELVKLVKEDSKIKFVISVKILSSLTQPNLLHTVQNSVHLWAASHPLLSSTSYIYLYISVHQKFGSHNTHQNGLHYPHNLPFYHLWFLLQHRCLHSVTAVL